MKIGMVMNQNRELLISWRPFPVHLQEKLLLVLARLVLIGGIGLFLGVAFWPGSMSHDSVVQYSEALARQFHDHHPPIMQYIWSLLLTFGDGPAPMLFFHLAMLLTACFIMSTSKNKSGTQWLWLFVPLLPWIAGLAGVIWKDVGMAFALFLSFALFQTGVSCKNKARNKPLVIFLFVMSLSFFLYGMFVRANAIIMALPFIYYSILIINPDASRKKSFCIACLCMLLLAISTPILNNKIIGAEAGYTRGGMQIHDIAATSVIAKKNLFSDQCQVSLLHYSDLPHVQDAKGWDYLKCNLSPIQINDNWKSVIAEYPLEYLKAKLRLLAHFSSFPFGKKHDAIYLGIIPNDYGFVFKENNATRLLKKYVDFFSSLRFPFVPLFWIPLSLYLFWAAGKREDLTKYKIRMLSGSAICYYFGYILVTPVPDYRFIYWITIGTTIASLVFYYSCPLVEKETAKKLPSDLLRVPFRWLYKAYASREKKLMAEVLDGAVGDLKQSFDNIAKSASLKLPDYVLAEIDYKERFDLPDENGHGKFLDEIFAAIRRRSSANWGTVAYAADFAAFYLKNPTPFGEFYKMLADDTAKKTFEDIIRYRLTSYIKGMPSFTSPTNNVATHRYPISSLSHCRCKGFQRKPSWMQ